MGFHIFSSFNPFRSIRLCNMHFDHLIVKRDWLIWGRCSAPLMGNVPLVCEQNESFRIGPQTLPVVF